MATEKKRVDKYKPMSGRLHEHFGIKLLANSNIKNADKAYCIHCDKSSAYHGSNMSLTYHIPNKHSLQYSKLQLSKSASFSQLTATSSSTHKQTSMSQFCHRSNHPVSPPVQRDIKISPVSRIASSSRPIILVEDDRLLLVF